MRRFLMENRLELLNALKLFLDNKEEMINIIFEIKNHEECKEHLKSKYKLSNMQAQVIIECQIMRLCEFDRTQLAREIEELSINSL